MADDVPVDSFTRDCPDCGAVVPSDAPRCPDCEATLDGEPSSGRLESGRDEEFARVGRDLESGRRDDGDGAGSSASRSAFAVAAATVAYLYVSYAMVQLPATEDVAVSTPVLALDLLAYVVLPVVTFVDATRVRAADGWSPRRWVWVPLVAVPILDLVTGPAYLLVRYRRT